MHYVITITKTAVHKRVPGRRIERGHISVKSVNFAKA